MVGQSEEEMVVDLYFCFLWRMLLGDNFAVNRCIQWYELCYSFFEWEAAHILNRVVLLAEWWMFHEWFCGCVHFLCVNVVPYLTHNGI